MNVTADCHGLLYYRIRPISQSTCIGATTREREREGKIAASRDCRVSASADRTNERCKPRRILSHFVPSAYSGGINHSKIALRQVSEEPPA